MKNKESTTITAVLAKEGMSPLGTFLSASTFDDIIGSLRSFIGKHLPVQLPMTIEQINTLETTPKMVDGPILHEVRVEGEEGERRAVVTLEFAPSFALTPLISNNRFSIGYTPPAGPIHFPPSTPAKLPSEAVPSDAPWNRCPACNKLADLPDFEQPGTRLKCCHCGEMLYADCFGEDDWRLLLASDVDGPESREDADEEIVSTGKELTIEFAREGEDLDGDEPTTLTPVMFDELVDEQRRFIGQPLPVQSAGDIVRGPVLKDVVVEEEDGTRVAIAVVVVDDETGKRFLEMVEGED